MIEVLWHGRGGQGAFTAARLLGAAASLEEGRYALAFPSFGPERRGAPMRAFTKMSDGPIGDRSAIAQADFVVYLDETLLGSAWESELKPGGLVLVNSAKPASDFGDERIVPLDADAISTQYLGRPIPNTVFLGALCALCDGVGEREVGEAIRSGMPPKLHEGNRAIVQEAARVVRAMREAAAAEVAEQATGMCEAGLADVVVEARPQGSRQDSCDGCVGGAVPEGASGAAAPARPECCIPSLRTDPLPSWQTYANNTCFAAGYLTDRNAGWRNKKPLIGEDACTGCLQCYLYCPDGAIFKTGASPKTPGEGAPVAVDYDFCKGCGVCVTVCAFGALAMVPEHDASDDGEAVDAAKADASVEGGAR